MSKLIEVAQYRLFATRYCLISIRSFLPLFPGALSLESFAPIDSINPIDRSPLLPLMPINDRKSFLILFLGNTREHTHRLPGPLTPVLNGQVQAGPSGLPVWAMGTVGTTQSVEMDRNSPISHRDWLVVTERQLRAFISGFYRIATSHPHPVSLPSPYSVASSPSALLSHPIITFVYYIIITSLSRFARKSRREFSRKQARRKATIKTDRRARSTKSTPSHELLAAILALALGDSTNTTRR